jgi:hypothetical protein
LDTGIFIQAISFWNHAPTDCNCAAFDFQERLAEYKLRPHCQRRLNVTLFSMIAICMLDLGKGVARFSSVNSSSQQFASSFARWYWFTNAADWRLRLQ